MTATISAKPEMICWCFGDSLTEGHTLRGGELTYTPYASMLAEISNGRILGFHAGFSGNTAKQLIPRLEQCLDDALQRSVATNVPVRAIAIMAGTNDLAKIINAFADSDSEEDCHGMGDTPSNGESPNESVACSPRMTSAVEPVVKQVTRMLDIIQTHPISEAATIFVLAVPPLGAAFESHRLWRFAVGTREALNQQLVRVCQQRGDRVVFVDEATPLSEPGTHHLRPAFDCGDALHMSTAGYRKIAECVASAALKYAA